MNRANAIRLLGMYTGGRFDIWAMSGPHNATNRAHVMSELTGNKVSKGAAGVNALEREFYEMCGIEGECMAERHERFREYCRELMAKV